MTELYSDNQTRGSDNYINSDNQTRGASVRLSRSGQTIKRPINKLYPLKTIEEKESKGNVLNDMIRCPRREAAIMGEVKRRYGYS